MNRELLIEWLGVVATGVVFGMMFAYAVLGGFY